MDIRPKKLSVIQMVGYEEELAVPTNQLCRVVYDLGQEFIDDMMDTVYSDGPVYFKSYPFSESNHLTVFTTFGNQVSPTGEDTGLLLFKQKLLVASEAFASFPSNQLQDYYDSLSSKYQAKDLEHLVVYHVLYHPREDIVAVDAYSSWEEE